MATEVETGESINAASSATSSATPENIPDITGEEIVLLHLCDRSGPFSIANEGRFAAVEDLVAAINADDGIFGARVVVQSADTKGTAEGAQAAFSNLLSQYGEGPILLICDPASELALRDLVNENELPVISPGVFSQTGGFLFGVDASPEQHFTFLLQDLVAHWAERRPQGAGNEIRVAILGWPTELSGDHVTEATLAYAANLGVEIVFQADLAPQPDFNIYDMIYQARDTHPNVIFTDARGFSLAGLLNGLNAVGLRDRFVVAAPAAAYDAELYAALEDPLFAENLYLTSAWTWWSENEHAGIQMLEEIQGDVGNRDWGYLQMAGAVDLARVALQNAILSEGYENLGPESIYAALVDLEELGILAGLFRVDYSGDHRSLVELRTWVAGPSLGQLTALGGFLPAPDF